jgi:photosystem II stability/assembly factor-like uncharacterized protein
MSWSSHLKISRAALFAAGRRFGKEVLRLALYAVWLVGEAAAAIWLLARGVHPSIVFGLLLALDVVGRGIFREGRTNPQGWLEWFRRDYLENIRKMPRLVRLGLAGLFMVAILHAAASAQKVWTKHPAPTADTLHHAFFINERQGRAIAHQTGLVLATGDGGKTWQIRARLGEGYLETIYFSDRQNGWIAGERGRLFKTSDGGKTWRSGGSFAGSYAFSAVHFFDKNHGFVFGVDPAKRTGVIFETRDGGRQWIDRSIALGDQTTLSDAIFRFGKDSFMIGGSSFLLRAEKGRNEFELTENKAGGTIRGLFFAGRENGWAVGHRGLLLRTRDGGKTWEKRAPFTATLLRSIHLTSEKNGFIVGNRDEAGAAMWQTADGGETWQAVKTDFPNLHRLVATRKKLWLFGAGGAIYSIDKN